jgi:hypothetical protein
MKQDYLLGFPHVAVVTVACFALCLCTSSCKNVGRGAKNDKAAAESEPVALAALPEAIAKNGLFYQTYGKLVSVTGSGHMRGFKNPGLYLMREASFEKGQVVELWIEVHEGQGAPAVTSVSLQPSPMLLRHFYDNSLTDAERADFHKEVLAKVSPDQRAKLEELTPRFPDVRDAVCEHFSDTLAVMMVQKGKSITITVSHPDCRP